ncbi:MAG: Gfo/Idh/MocA family oxidoreductase [Bacteroidales bacterium]
MRKYKWGILAPGRIAHRFAEGLQLLDNAVLWAVGSRNAERASEFAGMYGFKRSYGSYEELVTDTDLDVVYVASPHSHHHEHTLLCLNHGKHVICEKAFSLNLKEVTEMIETAQRKRLFLMEALWPPFQPSYREAERIINSGEMGEVLSMAGRFGFRSPYDPASRVFDLKLGGGSLLDIGIYPVMDILRYMGMPDEVTAIASFAPTGADDSLLAVFDYADGRKSTAYSSFLEDSGVGTKIIMDGGSLILERNRERGQILVIEQEDREPVTKAYKPLSSGFSYEAEEVMKCLDAGKTESEVVPHSFSHDLMALLDRIRNAAGIEYPGRLLSRIGC